MATEREYKFYGYIHEGRFYLPSERQPLSGGTEVFTRVKPEVETIDVTTADIAAILDELDAEDRETPKLDKLMSDAGPWASAYFHADPDPTTMAELLDAYTAEYGDTSPVENGPVRNIWTLPNDRDSANGF